MLFRLSEVYKSYSGTEILRGFSLQINPFEKVGLVGRNGAGKTTVFRLITEEETPDSGNVFKAKDLKIGLLAQHVDFAEDETVHTAALSAFKELHDIEAEMRRLETKMAYDASSEVLEEYAELQTEFENRDGFSYTAKAEAILLGIGFDKESWDLKTNNLSGGQKNRLGMVRLLLSNPDVLLLDEPTNHLDVNAVEWLENFLFNYESSYVVISHDRYFLDRTCRKIVEIENGKAVSYTGNYSKFLVERELRREQQQREFENQQAFINKTQDFIRKNLAGQKTKQAKSRRTMLEKIERIEAVAPDQSSGKFQIKNVERAGANVLMMEDLAVGYDENVLAEGINFTLHLGECLGIIGGNGTGKTTFLKTVLGKQREIEGKINWGSKTNIGYYSQQLEDLNEHFSIIEEIRRVAPSEKTGDLRSFLAGFLFFDDDVFKKVGDLSGGEKGRLALAKLIYSNVNVLVLDEPTNHLDIPSREALENALESYPGTILTVSHDRFFLDKVATQIFSFEGNGEIDMFNGNYSEFHDWKIKQESENGNRQITKEKTIIEEEKPTLGNKLSKNERQKIENRIKSIEREISQLEEEASEISIKMSESDTVSDYVEFQNLTESYQLKNKKIKSLYEEWEDLSTSLD